MNKRNKTINQVILDRLHSPDWCEVTPTEINDGGEAANFAWDVVEQMGGEGPNISVDATPDDEWGESDLPQHTWIIYEGRFYDAESPGGVTAQDQLPIFVRARKAQARK